MKTLLLLRHGKSSWKNSTLSDHDRPLKKRGRAAAKRVGQRLRELDLVPEHLLTSSAVRALETARRVIKGANYRGEAETVPRLYHADPPALVAIVSRVPNRYETILVVGHNPGLEEWLTRLSGRPQTLPTAALSCLELPLESWLDLTPDTRGELTEIWRPDEPSRAGHR